MFTVLSLLIIAMFFLSFCAAVIILQVFLSKRGEWLGLILPVCSFVLSLIVILSVAAFTVLRVTNGYTASYVDTTMNHREIVMGNIDYAWNVNMEGHEPDPEVAARVAERRAAIEQAECEHIEMMERHLVDYGNILPGGAMNVAATLVVVFIVMNIPTAVLLCIWLSFRGKRRRLLQLSQMNVKDL